MSPGAHPVLRVLSSLYSNERFSDATVIAGVGSCRRVWPVHRILLAATSSFFAERLYPSPSHDTLELSDLNPDVLDAFLRYVYGLDVTVLMPTHVLRAAEMFEVPEMRAYASDDAPVESVESVSEPVESVSEPVESVAELAESVAEPAEFVAESAAEPMEPAAESVEPAEPAVPTEDTPRAAVSLHRKMEEMRGLLETVRRERAARQLSARQHTSEVGEVTARLQAEVTTTDGQEKNESLDTTSLVDPPVVIGPPAEEIVEEKPTAQADNEEDPFVQEKYEALLQQLRRSGEWDAVSIVQKKPDTTRDGTNRPTPLTEDELAQVSHCCERADPVAIFCDLAKIGEGNSGAKIYVGRDVGSSALVAIKATPAPTAADMNEVRSLQAVKHPCIIELYRAIMAENHSLWIVLEYMPGGSLLDMISYRTLHEKEIATVLRPVVEALHHLHTHSYVHRDMKSDNILFTLSGKVKLADFGYCSPLQPPIFRRRSVVGTPYWMAPEVVKAAFYDTKVDIWGIGILGIEMAQGHPPHFKDHTPLRAMILIATGDPPRLAEPDKWSESFRDFLSLCTAKSPDARATAEQLLQHPFLSNAEPSILTPLIREASRNALEKRLARFR